MRHFDHGYAVTSHSSQGLTADRVLVNMDTKVHPELINTRFAYVSVSRASEDVRIYTNDVAILSERLSTDVMDRGGQRRQWHLSLPGRRLCCRTSATISKSRADVSRTVSFWSKLLAVVGMYRSCLSSPDPSAQSRDLETSLVLGPVLWLWVIWVSQH